MRSRPQRQPRRSTYGERSPPYVTSSRSAWSEWCLANSTRAKTRTNWAAVSSKASAKTFCTRSSTSLMMSSRSLRLDLRSSSWVLRNWWRSSRAANSSSASGLTRPSACSPRSALRSRFSCSARPGTASSRSASCTSGADPVMMDKYAAKLALIHSEVTEVLEALRKSQGIDKVTEEFADILIRTFDLYGTLVEDGEADPNLYAVMRDKMETNKNRPAKHGNRWG